MNKAKGIVKVLVSKEDLEARIKEIAAQLDKDYKGKTPLCVCLLNGSFLFFSDLVKAMQIPVMVDFVSVNTHGKTSKIQFVKDLENNVKGKHVILVEDILDSGTTLFALKDCLEKRDAESVKIVTLLDKKARRDAPVSSDYTCFTIEDEFAVGYGLDYAGQYRTLDFIGSI